MRENVLNEVLVKKYKENIENTTFDCSNIEANSLGEVSIIISIIEAKLYFDCINEDELIYLISLFEVEEIESIYSGLISIYTDRH